MARNSIADQLAAHLESAGETKGYKNAIRDVRREITALLDRLAADHTVPTSADTATGNLDLSNPKANKETRRPRQGSDQQRVLELIQKSPGLRGVEIAQRLAPIHERTVRTALSRLKKRDKIEQREGGWHMKNI
jgi:predicted transcriptional regulator